MPDETAADVARTEAARQLIILVFGIAGALAFVWVQRSAANPDAARSGRMRLAKSAERGWARLAAWSWEKAEAARVAYEKDRG